MKKILISGSSGFIGSPLVEFLRSKIEQYEVYTLVRRPSTSRYEIEWNPERGQLDKDTLENLSPNVVIHLSGENIVGFWTEDKKRKILESRVKPTHLLCETLAGLKNPPQLFISASGCTIYGTNCSSPTDEFAPKGQGFLADVVEKWEKACEPLHERNRNIVKKEEATPSAGTNTPVATRIVHLRIGLVLHLSGAFLGTIYYPFLFGLGGIVGSGQQYIPWVSMRDTLSIIEFIITNNQVNGPVNVSSINPSTNAEFTKTLGSVLNRPTICWVPEFLINMVMGKEMAGETMLNSQNIIPTKLVNYGFKFTDTNLYETLYTIVNE
ncbi:hypothetical protein CYY_002876 [Polysphondylium violaceum]|uniref:TIGR01777 family protein n=1 Tax=Polysphondylium violaceum TaxID=133409 RepID=A0A8J4V1U2_9MYCE|nr:hypothetical protein CYY_002876 [Polysphondylium violaceum]